LFTLIIQPFGHPHPTTAPTEPPAERPDASVDPPPGGVPAPSPSSDATPTLGTGGGSDDATPTSPDDDDGTLQTASPDGTSTASPALAPSDGGSLQTASPDGSSTASPALAPTGSGTAGEDCKTANGVYGSVASATQGEVVPFLYSVELLETLSRNDYLETVVPGLETDLSDYLVPVLFEECSSVLRSRRRLATRVVGLSSAPADTITSAVPYANDCVEADNCFPMLGQVTLYFANDESRRLQNGNNETTSSQKLLDALKEGMTAGQFDNNPPIARVRFLSEYTNTNPDDEGGDDDEDESDTPLDPNRSIAATDDGGVNTKLVAPLAVAGGLVLLVVAAILVRRRRPREDEAASEVPGPPDRSSSDPVETL